MNEEIKKKLKDLTQYILAYDLEFIPNVGADPAIIIVKASITFGNFVTHSFGQGKTIKDAQSKALLICCETYETFFPD